MYAVTIKDLKKGISIQNNDLYCVNISIMYQLPLCTPVQMKCISEIIANIETSDCLPQCSGLLVTSYRSEQIQNPITTAMNSLISKLTDYLSIKVWSLENMASEFKSIHSHSLYHKRTHHSPTNQRIYIQVLTVAQK